MKWKINKLKEEGVAAGEGAEEETTTGTGKMEGIEKLRNMSLRSSGRRSERMKCSYRQMGTS